MKQMSTKLLMNISSHLLIQFLYFPHKGKTKRYMVKTQNESRWQVTSHENGESRLNWSISPLLCLSWNKKLFDNVSFTRIWPFPTLFVSFQHFFSPSPCLFPSLEIRAWFLFPFFIRTFVNFHWIFFTLSTYSWCWYHHKIFFTFYLFLLLANSLPLG